MIKRLKDKLKHTDDHGSSFVLVIIATTFMCILAAALLMGAYMTYKLKFYKLNSLNNFYEVETALDEIYAGVGAATNEHLYSAYTTTAVFPDTDTVLFRHKFLNVTFFILSFLNPGSLSIFGVPFAL